MEKFIDEWDMEQENYIFKLYPTESKKLWYEITMRYVSEAKKYGTAYACGVYTHKDGKKIFSRSYLGNGSIEKCVHLINKDFKMFSVERKPLED